MLIYYNKTHSPDIIMDRLQILSKADLFFDRD